MPDAMVELRHERGESTGDAVNRLHRKPTHYKQKQEKTAYDAGLTNEEKRRNKTIFSFPQKISRSEKKKKMDILCRAYAEGYSHCGGEGDNNPDKQRSPKDESKRLLKVAATYSPTMQRSTIGDAELNDPVRNGKGWDLSAITTLIWDKGERRKVIGERKTLATNH